MQWARGCTPPGQTPSGRHPTLWDGNWSGRYASYWNASLLPTDNTPCKFVKTGNVSPVLKHWCILDVLFLLKRPDMFWQYPFFRLYLLIIITFTNRGRRIFTLFRLFNKIWSIADTYFVRKKYILILISTSLSDFFLFVSACIIFIKMQTFCRFHWTICNVLCNKLRVPFVVCWFRFSYWRERLIIDLSLMLLQYRESKCRQENVEFSSVVLQL